MSNDIVAAVKAGRPPFLAEGDRIAKFGKGYSNLLHLAGTEQDYPSKQTATHQHMSVTDNNNTSFMSPSNIDNKGYESASAMQTTVTADEAAGLPVHSKARFAIYRPELPNINDIPFSSMQATNIYRKKYSNYQREFMHANATKAGSSGSQRAKMAHNRILSQGNYTGGIKGYLGEDVKRTKAFRNNYLNCTASHNVSRE